MLHYTVFEMMAIKWSVSLTDFAECVLLFSSVHMEESSVMQGAQGMLVQNWPTVSSAAGESKSSIQDVG